MNTLDYKIPTLNIFDITKKSLNKKMNFEHHTKVTNIYVC